MLVFVIVIYFGGRLNVGAGLPVAFWFLSFVYSKGGFVQSRLPIDLASKKLIDCHSGVLVAKV